MWVAVRALGDREVERTGQVNTLGAVAHSAPIYVIVDDQPFYKTAAVGELVKEQRQLLQELLNGPVDPMGDLEAWETVDVLARQWERQRYLLGPRVEAGRPPVPGRPEARDGHARLRWRCVESRAWASPD